MAQRRGVEEELRVGNVGLAVVGQRLLQVADAHVVAGDGQVVAPEALAREAQIARRGLQRLGRVEALVHAPALALACGHAASALDPTREPLAGLDVDAQPEQAGSRLGEDLRQPGRALEVVGRARVGPSRALEQDDRLEDRRVQVGGPGHPVDERSPARGAEGGDDRPARALGVEHVAESGGGAPLELLAPVLVPGERVLGRVRVARAGRQSAGLVVAAG
jgi:hypothetical protein